MKKFVSYTAAFAALFSVAACSNKELNPVPDVTGSTVNIRFNAKNAGETKTGVVYSAEDKKHTPYWNNGDQIGVLFDEFTNKTKLDAILDNAGADKSDVADFSAEDVTLNNDTEPGDEGKVYSFYPASAFQSGSIGDKSVRVDVKSAQNPAAVDTYDPAADILVGQPSDYLFDDSDKSFVADIAFARVLSIVKISLKAGDGCPENLAVNKLTMTAPEGTTLTGRVTLSLDALYGEDSPLGGWTVKNEVVSAAYNTENKPIIGGSANTVYVLVNPTSIESGDITFAIDTDDYSIEKTVTLSNALAFPQGKVANINLSIAGTNCTEKVAETRIWVENFDKVTSQSQAAPNQTGAAGTGVTDALVYEYSTDNTNVRVNNNGHGSGNPFLWISGGNQYLQVSNIAVSGETDLKFSCQTKTISGSADITLKYKESTAEGWNTADGKISAGTKSIDNVQSLIFTISEEVTSLDLQIVGSAGNLVVDDIVLEKFVDERTPLDAPVNVTAAADANTSNKINVTWDAVENADSYEVTLQTLGEEDVVEDSETNSIIFTGLKYSTAYSVKVKAISSDVSLYKNSVYSTPVNVTTGAQPAVMIYFEKITSTDQIVDNEEYLIVHSADAIFDGSRNASTIDGSDNYIEITSSDVTANGISYGTYKDYCVYIASIEGGYSFKTKGGVYFGRTLDSNGFNTSTTSAYANTLTFGEDGTVVIKGTARAFGYLNNKFRFYAASNAKDIYLYKKADPREVLATPEITVTPDNTNKKISVSWTSVANAADYTVTCTGQTDQTVSSTSCEFTGLAYGDYTVTVQANPASDATDYKESAKASENVSIVNSQVGNTTTLDLTTKSASCTAYNLTTQYGDWKIVNGANNNNGWAYFKMGGKSTTISSSNPCYIYNTIAISHSVKKINVHLPAGSLSKSGMSVNSWGVYVYSDKDMVNQVDYVDGGDITKDEGSFDFTPSEGKTWNANYYYKISWNLANTTTTNGIICVDKITLYETN